jgi:hypothetical protein
MTPSVRFAERNKQPVRLAGGWFVPRGKYCWLVADKPNEQASKNRLDDRGAACKGKDAASIGKGRRPCRTKAPPGTGSDVSTPSTPCRRARTCSVFFLLCHFGNVCKSHSGLDECGLDLFLFCNSKHQSW